MPGSDAAGWTSPEVPTTSTAEARPSASTEASHASEGRDSPNHTTPGRAGPPQARQRGGARRPPSSPVGGATSTGAPQRAHRWANSEPCRWWTVPEPARSWRSSTFWVDTTTSRSRPASATATCPALGSTPATRCSRCRYQAHTVSGSRSNASGVARRIGSNRAQRASCASRNVGTPLSALIPAPDRTTSGPSPASSSRARPISGDSSGALIGRCPPIGVPGESGIGLSRRRRCRPSA